MMELEEKSCEDVVGGGVNQRTRTRVFSWKSMAMGGVLMIASLFGMHFAIEMVVSRYWVVCIWCAAFVLGAIATYMMMPARKTVTAKMRETEGGLMRRRPPQVLRQMLRDRVFADTQEDADNQGRVVSACMDGGYPELLNHIATEAD